MKQLLLRAAMLSSLAVVAPLYVHADITFLSDFESGDIQSKPANPDGWSVQNCPSAGYPQTLVTGSTDGVTPRAGKYMLRSKVRYTDPWGYNGGNCIYKARAELMKGRLPLGNGVMAFEKEYWISVSIYLPSKFGTDNKFDSVFQMVESNGVGGSPFEITLRDGRWIIRNQWGPTTSSDHIRVFSGSYTGDFDKWTDWTFHVKWSKTNGFVKAYKNGKLVGKREGRQTAYGKGDQEVYLKAGIYKPGWRHGPSNQNERVVYHDEIRMWSGDGGSIAKVTPKGGSEQGHKVALQPPSLLRKISINTSGSFLTN